jgi:predicted enzyme related to lactoylglutathione lyase
MIATQGRFVWYELMTTDIEAARAFYADVVGWGTEDASSSEMAYTLFTTGGGSVSGVMGLSADARRRGAKPSWIGYVGTDDVDDTTERLESLGGSVHVPPSDIPEVSRFSVAADPQKAMVGLLTWLKPGLGQPAELGTPGRVGWYELLAADCDKALAFYGELFGWQRADTVDLGEMGTYRLFSAGGQPIGGMVTKSLRIAAPFWLYYFNVADLEAAAKRVKAAGGRILVGPMEGPGGYWIVQCMDPQGAMFALMGPRNQDGGGQAPALEIGWSTGWGGFSSRGRVIVTKVPPRS